MHNATRYIFGPLIDSQPSHPDTVLSSILFIEEFMKVHKQKSIHLVADLQLYKVSLQIKWSDPLRWKNLYIRPGGMHILMSFIGTIGILMKGTGLEEILGAAYKGGNMLNGKIWGLRTVVTAILKPLVQQGCTTTETLMEAMENSRRDNIGRLWVDCLIIPVQLCHFFIRAEREGDVELYVYSLKQMLIYFFAAGHWNYARYLAWFIMELIHSLPEEGKRLFNQGGHVCRHKEGAWNGMYGVQFGEQKYIQYGKSKGGLVGLTLSQEQTASWVLSYHVCNLVSLAMDNLFEIEMDDDFGLDDKHKEEGIRRRKLDAEDREKIMIEVGRYPNPLQEPSQHLFNIVNGQVAGDKVNVHNAVSTGMKMAVDFQGSLPNGFHEPLRKQVTTMETLKKGCKVGNGFVYDMEKLYGRLLVVSQKRDINLKTLLSYELAPL